MVTRGYPGPQNPRSPPWGFSRDQTQPRWVLTSRPPCPHTGLRRGVLSVTVSLRTLLCPYGAAYRSIIWMSVYGVFKKSLCTPLCSMHPLSGTHPVCRMHPVCGMQRGCVSFRSPLCGMQIPSYSAAWCDSLGAYHTAEAVSGLEGAPGRRSEGTTPDTKTLLISYENAFNLKRKRF